MDSVASDPPVGLNLWTPHANPLMQQLLNYFAEQLPPENGGLSLVLFRKNKVILEKKVNDKWHVFLCHLNIKGHSLPDIIKFHLQYMCKTDVERKRLISSCVVVFTLWLINRLINHRLCGCFVCVAVRVNVMCTKEAKWEGDQIGLCSIRLSECQQPAVNTMAWWETCHETHKEGLSQGQTWNGHVESGRRRWWS